MLTESMKLSPWHLKKTTTDTISFYVACGVELHPMLHTEFLTRLEELEKRGSLCPLPFVMLERHSNKFKKAV